VLGELIRLRGAARSAPLVAAEALAEPVREADEGAPDREDDHQNNDPRSGLIRLVMTDRGIGIEKDDLSRIFDRFERAVSMRNFGGLGLGLFISRQIAEAHGGTIVVESQRGRGSTCVVTLPQRPGMRRTGDGLLEGAHH
jgi:signal transduction histidine kinase